MTLAAAAVAAACVLVLMKKNLHLDHDYFSSKASDIVHIGRTQWRPSDNCHFMRAVILSLSLASSPSYDDNDDDASTPSHETGAS